MVAKNLRFAIVGLSLLGAGLLLPGRAFAVPSYARQTGLPCAMCHTIYPALTPFGRLFKLNGYTMTSLPQVQTGQSQTAPAIDINRALPLSAVMQTTLTNVSKNVPGQQNPAADFPQELGIYLAGEITPHIGTFLQLTYSQPDGGVGLDMTDIRFADHATIGGEDTVYGITLNNAPSLEDVWNATPGFGPDTLGPSFVGSESAPGPAAGPFITNMAVAMNSLGLGFYAKRGDFYGDFSLYRSAMQGSSVGTKDMSLSGATPYARFAWSHDTAKQSLEFGVFGFWAKYLPMASSPTTDNYHDVGIDGQYQYFASDDIYELHASYVRENADWNATAASNPSDTTKFAMIHGSWIHQRTIGLSLGYFQSNGDADCLLYNGNPGCIGAATAIDGSANGKPDSAGFVASFDWLPWQNTKFTVQYTAYTKFNGGTSNYDGSGRNASDNNTLFLDALLAF